VTHESQTTGETDTSAVAGRVLVSFPSPATDGQESGWWSPDSDWLRENMNETTFTRYLRRAHAGPVSVGDEWAESVNCGCASPVGVTLLVERVEGGDAIGPATEIEVLARELGD